VSRLFLAVLTILVSTVSSAAQESPGLPPQAVAPQAALQARPAQRPADPAVLQRVDALVEEAIAAKQIPGAVLLVGRGPDILYQKAYGQRAVSPSPEPMSVDTIFDMASVTKVVATATAVMILVDEGKVRLTDRVAAYIPDFGRYGKGPITVRHLLTHVSGLRPDLDLNDDSWVGYDKAIELAAEEIPTAAPGERFVYSDINFFLLAEIVARASKMPFDRFVRERVFLPLGMKDSMFNPPEALRPRIAPTQSCTPFGWPCEGPNQIMLRGIVHDPTARRMQGVAGHAGLFSTAADMARYCQMILNGGSLQGVRVLSPLAVLKMTSPATPAWMDSVRGLGWDIDSSYSSNRGELLPVGSFGHTGFTGTSVWIDTATGVYIVLLANRVHPDGKGDATPLRARIATVVASSLRQLPPGPTLREFTWTGADFGAVGAVPRRGDEADGRTLNGIDVLRAEGFKVLAGKRVGLVTNHTGRSRTGEATIDLISSAPGVKLVALFSPEHGIRGILDEKVPSSTDEKTGLTIHSLYGDTRRPTPEMLKGIDTMVIDLQDIGSRFYTYMTTMAYVMEEAKKLGISVVVLDRINPVNGTLIEGPAVDKSELGFTAYFPMPVRHGMTMGELAKLFNAENSIGADLTVVPLKHWTRDAWFDETGLPWVNPSPNMRNMVAASVYTGVGAIEAANVSVGRGTDTPFEVVGAPWVDGPRLAAALNARGVPGIRVYPISFTPTASKFANEACQGVFIIVTDREKLRPVRLGLELAAALYRHHPDQFKLDQVGRLFGQDVVARLRGGEDPSTIASSWGRAESRWRTLRAKYLLYR
jgi:uncharacterized protein YbbC (DUF1343 family)